MLSAAFCFQLCLWRHPKKQSIEVFIGWKDESNTRLIVEGTDDPDGLSGYVHKIKFDNGLIEQFMIDEVITLDDLMDNVPIFC